MRYANYWTDGLARPQIAGPLPARTDVAIIGSGYTGLHAAIALRKLGADVAVLEAAEIGDGASSRNGGMATIGLKLDMHEAFRRYGPERARAFWHWAQDAIDHVERTVADESIDACFRRAGCVMLASKPAHFEAMRKGVAWYRWELDFDGLTALGPAELSAECGAQGYYGGLLDTATASLHPARYVFGLAEAAARRGASLVARAPVTSIQREERGWRVVTRKGSLKAAEVLLATNGYTTDLVPAARRGIFPAGSYIITTEPLPHALQQEISPRGRMFFDSKHFLNYFRLTPDGRMLFGGRHDLSTDLDLAESARLLRARMLQLFPALHEAPLSHAWSGRLGLTFDLMPHLGRVPHGSKQGGVWYAYGYAGHGVAIAGKLGKEAAEVIGGARPSSLFAEIPHARYPFTPYDRLYLPIISRWFRFLDLIQ